MQKPRIGKLVVALLIAPLALSAQSSDPWSALSRPRTLAPRPTTAEITVADLQTRVYQFADDSMEGRILGSRGNFKGTDYIAAELKRMGLEPAGENGTYFQTLPMVSRSLDVSAAVMVSGVRMEPWVDFIPRDQLSGQRSISGVPVVWGGDVSDSTTRLSGADVSGKLVVIYASRSVPGNPPGVPSRPQVNNLYRGAAGIAIVVPGGIPAASLGQYQQPLEEVLFGNPAPAPTYVYISTRMAEALFGKPVQSLTVGATGQSVQGNITWKNTPVQYPARNVMAILRGSDPTLRNEYVAVGAHNDHVGMGQPAAHDSMYVVNHMFRLQGADDPPPELNTDQVAAVNAALARIRTATNGASARLDSIYNGADDDASGSMAVLEIAERLASTAQRSRRSILFVWHVGEEAGLYGSQWFTDHPTVPRESIVAQLNVDMIGRGGADDVTGQTLAGELIRGNPAYVQSIGSRRLATSLGDLAERINISGNHGLKFDYSLDANGHPQNIYCRSDHYMYARYAIPVVFFTTGGHADYHQVTDESQYIDFEHLTKVTRYIGDLAVNVANLAERPLVDGPRPNPTGGCRQ